MASLTRSAVCLVLAGAAACATSNRATTSTGPGRWTGHFRTSGMSSSAVITGRTGSTRSGDGDITITMLDSVPARSNVDINITAPMVGGTQLAWAVFSGPCGSPTPAVTGLQEFPPLEVTSGGARARLDVHFVLKQGMEYHANIYNSSRATDVSDVMMCAPLSFGR